MTDTGFLHHSIKYILSIPLLIRDKLPKRMNARERVVCELVCWSRGLEGNCSSIQMNGGIMLELTTSRNYVNGSVAIQQCSCCQNINNTLQMAKCWNMMKSAPGMFFMIVHKGRLAEFTKRLLFENV